MAYNPYGVPGYGPPPTYGSYPGASHPPGMVPPPGLGPPPGMSSAPGISLPPGVQPLSVSTQANRPSGLPAFQPPPNLPNINFNAPVIRLGSTAAPTRSGTSVPGDRRDSHAPSTGSRPGLGMDRHLEQSRAQLRESVQALVAPTSEERLRTISLQKIPSGVGGEEGIQKLLSTVGRLRRWDSGHSHLTEDKGMLFGFAQYEDPESLSAAIDLLKDIEVPVAKQPPTDSPPKADEGADPFDGIEKVKLEIEVDASTKMYLESWKAGHGDDPAIAAKLVETREALTQFVRNLFYPTTQTTKDSDGDTPMADGMNVTGENVEVINIPLAQEDELADIPADMRETVAQEIAAFRERSNQRDAERLRQEEEHEERERRRNGAPRISRLGSPQPGNSNMIPLGPRGVPNAPSGPRGNRGVEFVNGGTTNSGYTFRDEDDTDTSDNELHEREVAKRRADENKLFAEAERKWLMRERMKGDALKREEANIEAEASTFAQRRAEQLEKEKNWDDELEATQRKHLYYRDHANWIKKRTAERDEEARNDDKDRQAEQAERRKLEAEMEQARGLADSFLEQQAEEMARRPAAPTAPAVAPQRFTMSLGAAAQRAQARAAPVRTMADIEGLLDDQEEEQTTKRQLVPIKFEPITDTKAMTEEDIQNAGKALAQEIPADREGLWAWDVKWDYLEDSVVHEKLRPFVEKKVVEFVGVQEQFLVDIVAEHIQKHGKPDELVDILREALDEDAEDFVKKLWRMVIFFTESEKRGLPA